MKVSVWPDEKYPYWRITENDDGSFKEEDLIEVPDELVAEFKALDDAVEAMCEKLEAIYEERNKT